MNLRTFICAVVFTVAALPFYGIADENPGSPNRDHRVKRMLSELGATPEQEAKLKEIHAETAPLIKVQVAHLEALRAKVMQELRKEKPDKRALKKYSDEIGKHHKYMNETMVDNMLKIKAVLAPEQFAKLSQKNFFDGQGKRKMVIKHKDGKEGKGGQKGAGMKPGDGPKHRYAANPGGRKGERERCNPEYCNCGNKKDKGESKEINDSPNTPVPIAPPIGTVPEGTSIGE